MCHRCTQRALSCTYPVTHKELSTIHSELLQSLIELPEDVAQDVLKRLRSGADLSTVLNQIKVGDLLLQLSVVPETRMHYAQSGNAEEFTFNNPYCSNDAGV